MYPKNKNRVQEAQAFFSTFFELTLKGAGIVELEDNTQQIIIQMDYILHQILPCPL